jgi:Thioredoxin-like
MPSPNERKNITWCVGTLLCFSFVSLVGPASAQTKADMQANDATGAVFIPVVVEAVTIQGTGDLSPDEKAKITESLKGEAYTEKWLKQLTDKAARLLQDEGFLDATTKVTVHSLNSTDGKQHVAATVDVDAGPRYALYAIWWRGSSAFTTKALDNIILARVGGVLGLSAIGESEILLRKAYAEQGYPMAIASIVWDKNTSNAKVTLYVEIVEGEKSGPGKSASERKPGCTTPTIEEIQKAPFAPRTVSYDPKVDAQLEIERAKLEAERTNRKVLLIAGGDWCGWCHTLDQTLERSVPVRELRDRNFVVVHISISEENENTCALRAYPTATSYPFLYVINPGGKLLATSDAREWESPYGYDPVKIEESLKKW